MTRRRQRKEQCVTCLDLRVTIGVKDPNHPAGFLHACEDWRSAIEALNAGRVVESVHGGRITHISASDDAASILFEGVAGWRVSHDPGMTVYQPEDIATDEEVAEAIASIKQAHPAPVVTPTHEAQGGPS